MTELAHKIYALIDTVSDQEAREALAEVVAELGLDVASNLIRENHIPSFMTKSNFEDNRYGEGNEDAGHMPLVALIKEVEKIINLDISEEYEISFDKTFVRLQTQEELIENGNEDSSTIWYTNDEKDEVLGKLIGFSV